MCGANLPMIEVGMNTLFGPPEDSLAWQAIVLSALCTAAEFPLFSLIGWNDCVTVLAIIVVPFVLSAALFGAVFGLTGIIWHGPRGLLGPGLLVLGINVLVGISSVFA